MQTVLICRLYIRKAKKKRSRQEQVQCLMYCRVIYVYLKRANVKPAICSQYRKLRGDLPPALLPFSQPTPSGSSSSFAGSLLQAAGLRYQVLFRLLVES